MWLKLRPRVIVEIEHVHVVEVFVVTPEIRTMQNLNIDKGNIYVYMCAR